MTSGRIAAEAIFQVKSRRDPTTANDLTLCKEHAERLLRHEENALSADSHGGGRTWATIATVLQTREDE
ncbi:hypothetical protein KIP88_38675 [Bradyrhizobium sp. SRL28]|nr:hypothetical protein [Bradyrhizobium sp. SRL28]